MPRRKKVETEETVEVQETPQVSQEDLLQLIAQMKKTMETQAAEIAELKSSKTQPTPIAAMQGTMSEKQTNIDRRTVKITSLYRGGILGLTGDHSHWLNFGDVETMSAKEAIKVVENNSILYEQGFFTVDQWLADEYGWTSDEHLLTAEEIADIFEMKDNDAIELFSQTTPGQRTAIIDYIEKRILGDGEFENINLAIKIGKLIGKDYLKLLNDNQLDDEDRASMPRI